MAAAPAVGGVGHTGHLEAAHVVDFLLAAYLHVVLVLHHMHFLLEQYHVPAAAAALAAEPGTAGNCAAEVGMTAAGPGADVLVGEVDESPAVEELDTPAAEEVYLRVVVDTLAAVGAEILGAVEPGILVEEADALAAEVSPVAAGLLHPS